MNRFTLLLVSQWIANAGDALYIVSLIAMIYQTTGQASLAALFPVLVTAGMTGSGFLFAQVAQRVPHASLLFGSQLLKTILLGVIWGFDLPLPLILALVGCIAFFDGFARPIESAFIPRLCQDVQKANSLVQGSNQVIQLIMWPLGAILVSWLSPLSVLSVSAGLFLGASLISYLFYRSVRSLPDPSMEEEDVSFRSSIRYTRSHSFAKANTYLVGIDAFVSTAWISALFLVYIDTHFQLSERWWGILNAFYLLSMIAGSYMMLRRRGTRSLLYRSIGFSIVATFLFAFAPIVTLVVIACLFQGFASQVRAIELNTLLQTTTPLERLPYVYSVQQTVYALCFCLGSLLFGWLADLFAIEIVYALAGVLSLLMWQPARQVLARSSQEQRHVS